MSYADEILERRKNSVFRDRYEAHAPEVTERTGKCFCCGRSFDYPEALNRFEAFIEERNGSFFAMDSFRDEMCADCAKKKKKNSTWMEIL